MNTPFRQAGVQRSGVEVPEAPRSAQGSVQRPPCKGLSSRGGRLRKPCLLRGTEDVHTWSWSELSPDVMAPQPRHPLSRALPPPSERPSSTAGTGYSTSRRHKDYRLVDGPRQSRVRWQDPRCSRRAVARTRQQVGPLLDFRFDEARASTGPRSAMTVSQSPHGLRSGPCQVEGFVL